MRLILLAILMSSVVLAEEFPHPIVEGTVFGYTIQHPDVNIITSVLVVKVFYPDGHHHGRTHSVHIASTLEEADAKAVKSFKEWIESIVDQVKGEVQRSKDTTI